MEQVTQTKGVTPVPVRIGVDLGGTNIAVGLVDDGCNLLAKASVPTRAGRPFGEIVDDMAGAVQDLVKEQGLSLHDCTGVGVGVPGTCDGNTGTVCFAPNLFWKNVPLRDALHTRLGVPVHISNDANCAALGEQLAGAAKGYGSVICITLGTGVGGGIILDGRLFEGNRAMGAEVGHMVIDPDGPLCGCGRHGCFETFASSTALIRQTRELMEREPDSGLEAFLKANGTVSGRTAFLAARAGNEAGARLVKQYVRYLGIGVTNLINVFMPEAVLIGGGISGEGEYLLTPLRRYVKEHVYGGNRAPEVAILKATLGNDAGIIGAAMLR